MKKSEYVVLHVKDWISTNRYYLIRFDYLIKFKKFIENHDSYDSWDYLFNKCGNISKIEITKNNYNNSVKYMWLYEIPNILFKNIRKVNNEPLNQDV